MAIARPGLNSHEYVRRLYGAGAVSPLKRTFSESFSDGGSGMFWLLK